MLPFVHGQVEVLTDSYPATRFVFLFGGIALQPGVLSSSFGSIHHVCRGRWPDVVSRCNVPAVLLVAMHRLAVASCRLGLPKPPQTHCGSEARPDSTDCGGPQQHVGSPRTVAEVVQPLDGVCTEVHLAQAHHSNGRFDYRLKRADGSVSQNRNYLVLPRSRYLLWSRTWILSCTYIDR